LTAASPTAAPALCGAAGLSCPSSSRCQKQSPLAPLASGAAASGRSRLHPTAPGLRGAGTHSQGVGTQAWGALLVGDRAADAAGRAGNLLWSAHGDRGGVCIDQTPLRPGLRMDGLVQRGALIDLCHHAFCVESVTICQQVMQGLSIPWSESRWRWSVVSSIIIAALHTVGSPIISCRFWSRLRNS
jgi:hypothetical protein